jgi:hypothetical protein
LFSNCVRVMVVAQSRPAMTLFELPAGTRASIDLGAVGVITPRGDALKIDRATRFEATATADFCIVNGVRRRRFVDASIELMDGKREVWLTDIELSP